jgi:RimJ/RimL family protein N-acetyltransferase
MKEQTFVGGALQSDRMYLRELRLSDVNEHYYQWMHDAEVNQYLESRFAPKSMEDLRQYVSTIQADRDYLFLAIVVRKDDRHIGNIKLGPINWIHRFGDVGLLIGEKDCWGKGYATEAISLLTAFSFNTLNLHRLTAGCYSGNLASAKAFLKAGWKQEGLRKSHFYCNGEYVDEILLGIVRDA